MSIQWFSQTHPGRRLDQIRVQHLLGQDFTMVCPDKDHAKRVADELGLRTVSADVPKDLPPPQKLMWKRRFMDECVYSGEWWGCVNENIGKVTCLPAPYFDEPRIDYLSKPPTEWKSLYATPLSVIDFRFVMQQLVEECDRVGTNYGGIGGIPYWLMRSNKFSYMTFIRDHCFVSKRDGGSWFPSPKLTAWEDWYRTLDVLRRCGSVVCMRYAIVSKIENEAGGVSVTEADRYEIKVETAKWLMSQFPGLVGLYKGRPDALTIIPRSLKQLQTWRDSL